MRKYKINESFFKKIDTEEKAYWLGFIVADGTIGRRNNISCILKIALSPKDKSQLLKFLKSIDSNYPIHRYKVGYNKEYITDEICIYSKVLIKDLKKYGVVSRKTFKTFFPNILSKLQRHFIRGYFDGDGCIFLSKNSNISSRVSIRGTLTLLQSIQNLLIKNCNVNKTKILKNNGIWDLQYGGNKQVKRILNYLYKDSNIYLNRKNKLYNKFIKSYIEPHRMKEEDKIKAFQLRKNGISFAKIGKILGFNHSSIREQLLKFNYEI